MNPEISKQRYEDSSDTHNAETCSLTARHNTEERIISCGEFTLRCSFTDLIPTSLYVDVHHERVPGAVRTFDLSQIVREAYERAPTTVNQIVNPESSLDMRCDAMAALTRHVVKGRQVYAFDAPVQKILSLQDIFEPSFGIAKRIGTEWGDLLKGQRRYIVAVLRNDAPFVEFSITEDRNKRIVSSFINIIPAEVRWPLLTSEGESPNARNIAQTLDSYILVLHRAKCFSSLEALEGISRFQESRMSSPSNEEFPPGTCLAQVTIGMCEESQYADSPDIARVYHLLAPFRIDAEPVVLPDKRVLWLATPEISERAGCAEIRFGGFSEGGIPYACTATVPRDYSNVAWRAVWNIRCHQGWDDIEQGWIDLTKIPKIEFKLSEPGSREEYPHTINALIEVIRSGGRDRIVGVGLSGALAGGDQTFNARVLSALARGYVPIHAVGNGQSLGSAWTCEAFLDDELTGRVIMTNKLGGRIVATLGNNLLSVTDRLELLRVLIEDIYKNPSTLSLSASRHAAFEIQCSYLPKVLEDPVYAMVENLAQVWQAPQGPGRFAFRDLPFRAERLIDGRWALTKLLSSDSLPGRRDATTLVIGRRGVEGIFLTCGKRTILGTLTGTFARPPKGTRVFSDGQLSAFLTELKTRENIPSQEFLTALLNVTIPHLQVNRQARMRQLDPERGSRDLIFMVQDWFARFLGWQKSQ